MPNYLTVLRSRGPVLAKTWCANNTIWPYANAQQFTVRVTPYSSTRDLIGLLRKLSADCQACFIRGAPTGALAADETTARKIGRFIDAPSVMCALDIDGYAPEGIDALADPLAAIEHYIEHKLPKCFHGISYVWHLSGSMGHPTKPRQLRCHLYYTLAVPLTCVEMEAWAREHVPACDHTVHRIVQVNYTSDPVLAPGQLDPLEGRRLGYAQGYLDEVLTLPADMPVPDVSRLYNPSRGGRRTMLDPRGKPGVIGALCRAYSPEQLPELLPDLFAASADPRRITWLAGGGTPEGVRVTDDGLHLFNSHHTAPVQHAAHLFDFIRAHVHADLDDGLDPDALAFAPEQAPSYLATREWALALPEVAAELAGPQAQAAEAKRIEARQDTQAEQQLSDADERADRLERVLKLVEKASRDRLELELAREASRIKWTDTEREMLVQAMQRRTKALGGGRGVPVAQVRGWLAPRNQDGALLFPDTTREGHPKLTLGNMAALLAQLGWRCRYNVISKRQEVLGGPETLMDNRDNVILSTLVSECGRADIPQSQGTIMGYLAALCDANPYNPVQTWIDARAWDGVSRLAPLAATLGTAEGFDAKHKALILRKWLIQCIAVAFSPSPVQARGVLSLPGPQYIGKSRWFQALCKGGPEGLVVTGRLIDPHSKDSAFTAICYWICEMGELDATMGRAHQGALKAFISQDVDTLRLPYAARDSSFQRRTCFVASVNNDSFLADETGNTRFWVLPVVSVNADHDVDMQQLWAEVATLWRGGETHWFSQDEMREVSKASEPYRQQDPIHEAIADRFPWPEPGTLPGAINYTAWLPMSCSAVLKACDRPRPTGADLAKTAVALKKLGAVKAQRQGRGSSRGWLVPPRGSEFGDEDD